MTAYMTRSAYRLAFVRKRPSEERLVDHDSPALAHGARLRERLDQALGDPLAGHLHQAKVGDVEHLGPRLVAGQGVLEGPQDLVAVLPDLHVDEVDDDDPADVAQAQLASDLLGRLQVVAVDGLLEARGA